jgi:hypothetical protein
VAYRRRENVMARGVGGQSPSNVQTFLKGVSYPAKKDDLLKAAKNNGAPREIVDILKGLSAEEFGGPQEVMKGYGEERQNSDSK